ncbi:hypothetical protein [uncultured Brevibacillus sp.]|uniref:hypothetical protein n=1 Tax=uncultured Brevibacillus sp. TaxID=169970 RepID=UPI00259434F4|nr:hypothetical protein [uncultured Brevibacillus sp.]
MGLYEVLIKRKKKGEKITFDTITPDELKQLFITEQKTDKMLAELFEVSRSRIAYKRKKYKITIRNSILNEILLGTSEEAKKINEQVKQRILTKDNINMISKAVTHFAFRNGPIEDMHANNQLTEEDMKTLNKFMVNRLAYIFSLITEERWGELDILLSTTNSMFGHGWDEAEPDDGGTKEFIQWQLEAAAGRDKDSE